MRTTVRLVIVLLTVILIGIAAWKISRPDAPSYSETLARTIKEHESELAGYIGQLLDGKIVKEDGMTSFPPPKIDGMKPGIFSVSVDANTNVYFITDNSWVTFNTGFIYNTHDRPIIGDGQEPELVNLVRLEGKWFQYTAR